MMNRYIVWLIVVLYWLSPVDLLPGNPIDDVILAVLAWHRDEVMGWIAAGRKVGT